MSTRTTFIGEIKNESASTNKMLERVPLEKTDWRPHEKSMSLGRLATHIAEIPIWVTRVLEADEFDFDMHPFRPRVASSMEELLEIFHSNEAGAIDALEHAGDDELEKVWSIKRGGQVAFRMPKKVAIRAWGISHFIHHRGQLSVYLRILGIGVPGMYGPSADER